jgi:MFS family permease
VDSIDRALDAVDSEWRAYGLGSRDRTTLAADLRVDLQSAVDDGAEPGELLGPDVRGFARRLADEAGLTPLPAEYARVMFTGLVGGLLGLAAGYVVVGTVFSVCTALFDLAFRPPLLLAVLVVYGSTAAFVVGGAVAAVRTRLRDLPQSRSTAATMGVTLPVGGLVATALAAGLAALTNYRLVPQVVCCEVALVLATVAGAIALARWWSIRNRHDQVGMPSAVPA